MRPVSGLEGTQLLSITTALCSIPVPTAFMIRILDFFTLVFLAVALAIAIGGHVTKKLFTVAIGIPATASMLGSQWRHVGTYFNISGTKFNG